MVLIPPGFRDSLVYFNSRDLISNFDIDVVPTDGAEVISGHTLDDVLFGLGGNDRIVGNGGDDIIFGDEGRDTLSGNAGNDLLGGGDGDDRIRGHSGNDSIDGGAGNDVLQGYRGRDEFQGGSGDDLIIGGAGKDIAHYLNNLVNEDGTLNYDFVRTGNARGFITDLVGDEGTDELRSVEHLKFADIKVKNNGENNAPIANDDEATTDEDTPVALDLFANDVEIDRDFLGLADDLTLDSLNLAGLVGVVNINPDGTGTFDPTGAFDFLGDGETDTTSFEYTVTDDFGLTDTATVEITVTGVNDAPFTTPDSFFVESGDVDFQQVLNNDTDVDGIIVGSTIAVATPAAQGSATADQAFEGIEYIAPDIGGDMTDDSVVDTYEYTVADDDGAVSDPTQVDVMVIDPLVETDTDSVVASTNGQTLTLELSTEDRTFNNSSFVDVDLVATGLTAQDVNVSFVIDGSGSVDPTDFSEQVQAIRNSVSALRSDFAGSLGNVQVQLIEFSDNATSFGIFDLNDLALDTAINSIVRSGQTTNYESALQAVQGFLNAASQAGEENFIFFASDGVPNNNDFLDEAAQLQSIAEISAVGFGGGIDTATLDQIDNTGGSQVVANAAELGNAFATSPLFLADLVDFSLTISENGGPAIEIATEADLVSSGGGNFTFDDTIISLLNDLGDETLVTATAVYDTDGDLGTTGDQETLMAQTAINGTDGTDILAFI